MNAVFLSTGLLCGTALLFLINGFTGPSEPVTGNDLQLAIGMMVLMATHIWLAIERRNSKP